MTSSLRSHALIALCSLGLISELVAQVPVFDSKSDGSYGPLNVTEDTTLFLPPDGILNCTTIDVAQGATLRFGRNALNTPVYLLATGEVNIAGLIDVSGTDASGTNAGLGGPGGWPGGTPGTASTPPGDGLGPGGGKAGTSTHGPSAGNLAGTRAASGGGSYASFSTRTEGADNHGAVYGSALLIPLMGGSGGAGTVFDTGISSYNGGGGGGGGAILIASNSKISISGTIRAEGGLGGASGYWTSGKMQLGSGGAIRLVAPEVVGSGRLETSRDSAAGYGRLRIDAALYDGNLRPDATSLSVGFNPLIFPVDPPHLRLKNVAGTEIAADNTSALIVTLPADGVATQPVTVEASRFGTSVAFVVTVVPEIGPTVRTEGTVDNTGGGTSDTTIDVEFPLNSSSQIFLWTKQLVASPDPAP